MTPEQKLTIEELIQRIKQGVNQESCFQELFTRYARRLTLFFRRKGLSPEDSRDLVQETFLSLYRGLPGFRQEERFQSWLFVIAGNQFRSWLEARGAKKRAGHTLSLDQEMGEGEGEPYTLAAKLADQRPRIDEEMLQQEKRRQLHAAMKQLSPQRRRCVELRVIFQLPYQEIADEMGLALGTVKAHIHQAQEALRKELRPYFGEIDF